MNTGQAQPGAQPGAQPNPFANLMGGGFGGPMGGMGMPPMDFNTIAQMMQNPFVQNMMQQMMSNPALLQQVRIIHDNDLYSGTLMLVSDVGQQPPRATNDEQ